MQIYDQVELECVFCGHDQPHELLYLSGQMRASRCGICGRVLVFSGPLAEEHAIDLFRRTLHLPYKLSDELNSKPLSSLLWPMKILRKPFQVAGEARKVESFRRYQGRPVTTRGSRG